MLVHVTQPTQANKKEISNSASSNGEARKRPCQKRQGSEGNRQAIFTLATDNEDESDHEEDSGDAENVNEEELAGNCGKTTTTQVEVASRESKPREDRTGSSGAQRDEASQRAHEATARPVCEASGMKRKDERLSKDDDNRSLIDLEEGKANVLTAAPNNQAIQGNSKKKNKRSPLVFDPSGAWYHRWSMVVSLAFLYNFWSLSYRFAFREIDANTFAQWFALDYSADFIYILDIFINFHTGYLEDGVLQRDIDKISNHYKECTTFYLDMFCLLPLDILYLTLGFNSILRCTRLVKIHKFWSYVDRTERHTNYPNVFRTFSLVHYILVIFHWNACLFHMISKNKILDVESLYKINDNQCDDILCQYLHAFYWSTLALTTIGDLPRPRAKGEYVYITFELFFGLFLFASVLGHVANIVTNVSAARKEFQAKLDAVKTFMRMRRVSDELQNKVIRWFDYLWISQKSSDEDKSVACLPDRLKAEIAIHVHLDTLKRVDIFQNTEAGFLCELVLRLKPVLFSPGDYVCRKDEVGHEMYIVSRGILQVVAEGGKQVVATLKAGSYFGEISVLNVGLAGNKRTASVRSVGYSDLFCLNKQDLWDVLKNYPNAEARIRARAEERLSKLDINKQSLRGKSRQSRAAPAGGHTATSGRQREPQIRCARQLVHSYSSNCKLGPVDSFSSSQRIVTNNNQRQVVRKPLMRDLGIADSGDEGQHELFPTPAPAEDAEEEEEEELIYNWSGHKSSVGRAESGGPNCHWDGSLNPAQLANNANNQPPARRDNNKYHRSPGANHSSSFEGPNQEGCCCSSNRKLLHFGAHRIKGSPRLGQANADFCWPRLDKQTGNGGSSSRWLADNASEGLQLSARCRQAGQPGPPASLNDLAVEKEDGAANDMETKGNLERRCHLHSYASLTSGSSDCPSNHQLELSPSAGSAFQASEGRNHHHQHRQCLYASTSKRRDRYRTSSCRHHFRDPTGSATTRTSHANHRHQGNPPTVIQQGYWLPVSPTSQLGGAGFIQVPAIVSKDGGSYQFLHPIAFAPEGEQGVSFEPQMQKPSPTTKSTGTAAGVLPASSQHQKEVQSVIGVQAGSIEIEAQMRPPDDCQNPTDNSEEKDSTVLKDNSVDDDKNRRMSEE